MNDDLGSGCELPSPKTRMGLVTSPSNASNKFITLCQNFEPHGHFSLGDTCLKRVGFHTFLRSLTWRRGSPVELQGFPVEQTQIGFKPDLEKRLLKSTLSIHNSNRMDTFGEPRWFSYVSDEPGLVVSSGSIYSRVSGQGSESTV